MQTKSKKIENLVLGMAALVAAVIVLTSLDHKPSATSASSPSRVKGYRDLTALRADASAAAVVRIVGKPFERNTGEVTLLFARLKVNKVMFGDLVRNDVIETVMPLEPASKGVLLSGGRALLMLTRYEVVRGQPRTEWVIVGDGAGVFKSKSSGDEADSNDAIEEEFSKTDSMSKAFPPALVSKGRNFSVKGAK